MSTINKKCLNKDCLFNDINQICRSGLGGTCCGYQPTLFTQADRLRTMSNEELAHFLSEKTGMRYMNSHWLNWLQEEICENK